MLVATVIINVLFLFLEFIRYTPVLSGFAFAAALLLPIFYLLVSVISLIYAITFFKNKNVKVLLPLSINVITFLIIYFLPIENFGEKIIFNWQLKNYENAVSLIEQNKISIDEKLTRLPQDLNLSTEYAIVYREQNNQFIVFLINGFLSHYSAYVYSKNDAPPTKGPYDDPIRIIFIKTHWYRIEH